MTTRDDFTRAPRRQTPRERLAPTLRRGRERETSHERRAVPPIESIRVERVDCNYMGSGVAPTMVALSLPRVRFLERPEI
ncbi:hypothetical protein [Methylosinus sp. Sm6]|uniref:hypothetical protein n=1 Tax=Methylosinus sp. Sm6 TaxID=2866948 RepID=UPI001C99E137|nr:hypothetical protein [Methylosinus sp. Sm6]MBY6242811.1 hypothetical protein [Methylosinus sp. Sm6]